MQDFESCLQSKLFAEANQKVKRSSQVVAVILSVFGFAVFATYTAALYIGCIFVDNFKTNSVMQRYYSNGDILSILFGVLFSLHHFVAVKY